MDSELKREICPLIRQMFQTVEEIKIWAPEVRKGPEDEEEPLENQGIETAEPAYQPPPSVEKFLRLAEDRPAAAPQILQPPPPARVRIHWRQIIPWGLGILFILAGVGLYPQLFRAVAEPTQIPTGLRLMQPTAVLTSAPTAFPTQPPEPIPTPTASPALAAVITRIAPLDGMVLVFIPAGEFKMGSARIDDPEALDEELPQHLVDLHAFWIDQTEVTNAQYALCVADGGACTPPVESGSLTRSSYYGNSQYASYPVIFVSWSQAAAYCAWAGRRLPTEAEWEKAARGPDGWVYPWGNTFDGTLVNYCDVNCPNVWKGPDDDGYADTSPVGDYPDGASDYLVLDMAGNIYEWVADWYGPYSRQRQINPTGPASGQEHIIRGGSWGDDSRHVRAAVRSQINTPDFWTNFIGFRCAVDAD
jgi:formylglycine-generating enzyme required for sulfatase activity